MNTSELIAALEAEISRLQQARKLVAGNTETGMRKTKVHLECGSQSTNQRGSEEEMGEVEQAEQMMTTGFKLTSQ